MKRGDNMKKQPIPELTGHEKADYLRSYIAKYGKRINEQIANLERENKEFSSIEYRMLLQQNQNDLLRSKSGHIKINLRTTKSTIQQLRHIATLIQNFGSGVTNTLTGQKQYFGSIQKTISEKYDISDFSLQEFAELMASKAVERLNEKIGVSEMVLYLMKEGNSADKIENILNKLLKEMNTTNGLLSVYKTSMIIEKETGEKGFQKNFIKYQNERKIL